MHVSVISERLLKISGVIAAVMIVMLLGSSEFMRARQYSRILIVTEGNTEQIPTVSGSDESYFLADSYAARTVTVVKLQTMDIDGNTYLYIVDENEQIYRALYADVTDMLFVNEGGVITILTNGNEYLYTR